MILANTIKGYGLGEAGEGRNITHQQKKLNEEELREFRTRFGIPISDDEIAQGAVLPAAGRQPGDAVPARAARGARRLRARTRRHLQPLPLETPPLTIFDRVLARHRRPRGLDDDGVRADAVEAAEATRRSAS